MSRYSHNRKNLDDPLLVKGILDYHHNEYIQKCRISFPYLPDLWLKDQENYHKWLVQLEPKELIENVTRPTLYALNLLLNTNAGSFEDIHSVCEKVFSHEKNEHNLAPWQFNKLFDDIQKLYRGENVIVKTHSLVMTVCGLLSIFWPVITRARIYLIRQNAENQFNVGYSDYFLEDESGSVSTKKVIDESYRDLIQEAINVRRLPNTDRDNISSHVGEAIQNAFRPYFNPLDGFVAAATGNDDDIKHIPKRASDRYLPYHIKKRNDEHFIKSLDTPIHEDSELTLKDLLQAKSELNLLEEQELKDLIMHKIDDPNLLTQIQRKVIKTYFGLFDGNPLTFRKTGELLGMKESTVYEHLQAALRNLKLEIPS